jgi:hypothetical protein
MPPSCIWTPNRVRNRRTSLAQLALQPPER